MFSIFFYILSLQNVCIHENHEMHDEIMIIYLSQLNIRHSNQATIKISSCLYLLHSPLAASLSETSP